MENFLIDEILAAHKEFLMQLVNKFVKAVSKVRVQTHKCTA